MGWIDYHCLALDGTKIRANVSRSYTGTLKDFRKRVGAIDVFVGKALERLAFGASDDAEHVQRTIDKARSEQERIKRFLVEASEQFSVTGKEKKQNITDPDSRVMVMPDGTCREAYNAQACVDAKQGELKNTQVLADAGYQDHSATQNPDTNIPPKASLVVMDQQGTNVTATCSGGKKIPALPSIGRHKNKNHGDDFRTFPTRQDGTCIGCPLQSTCFPPGRKEKVFTMSVNKVEHHKAIREVAERMGSATGIKVFSRFLRRGLASVGLEWTLLCTAFNLRRMYAASQQG